MGLGSNHGNDPLTAMEMHIQVTSVSGSTPPLDVPPGDDSAECDCFPSEQPSNTCHIVAPEASIGWVSEFGAAGEGLDVGAKNS